MAAYPGHAQYDPEVENIVQEGRLLYRTEMASWYGSDIYRQRFGQSENQAGGYISYPDGWNTICVFYSKHKSPVVLATVTFDKTFNRAAATVDSTQRNLSEKEGELYKIRKSASELVNSDTLFKVYQDASLNLIPLADSLGKRVYILTGPNKSGVVIIGNDYLIRFDENNHVTEKRPLHQGIFEFRYKDDDDVSFHTHAPSSGRYITPTDICTLLLYERFTPWKQHVVISGSNVSIWDTGMEELTVIPREVWDEMMAERRKDGQ